MRVYLLIIEMLGDKYDVDLFFGVIIIKLLIIKFQEFPNSNFILESVQKINRDTVFTYLLVLFRNFFFIQT